MLLTAAVWPVWFWLLLLPLPPGIPFQPKTCHKHFYSERLPLALAVALAFVSPPLSECY